MSAMCLTVCACMPMIALLLGASRESQISVRVGRVVTNADLA